MSDKHYFDGVKVGDRVYSVAYGWGTVREIELNGRMRIDFCFKCGNILETYTPEGVFEQGLPQTLFWDKPEFTPPPRPKRKVKKTIERWMNVYNFEKLESEAAHLICIHASKKDADREANPGRIACVKLTGEYEVEE